MYKTVSKRQDGLAQRDRTSLCKLLLQQTVILLSRSEYIFARGKIMQDDPLKIIRERHLLKSSCCDLSSVKKGKKVAQIKCTYDVVVYFMRVEH